MSGQAQIPAPSAPCVPTRHLVGPLGMALADYPVLVERALASGCDAIHLRLPGGAGGELLAMARQLRTLTTAAGALLIVNERVDVALCAMADGVQLGERGLPLAAVRELAARAGQPLHIGCSVHDRAGASAAAQAGADWLLAGHIFASASHPGEDGRGLPWLTDLCRAVPVPVIAIGGITAERVPQVLAAGAHGVAFGRAAWAVPTTADD